MSAQRLSRQTLIEKLSRQYFMTKYLCCSLLFIVSLFFSGCAWQPIPMENGQGSYQVLPKKYQKKALDYERRGLYREAIQSWLIVLGFQPDNVKIKQKINTLRKKSMDRASAHYKQGVAFYRQGKLKKARREFLLTLAYDQHNKSALKYLKEELQPPVIRIYVVKTGDTVRKIAAKELRDPGKGPLIMEFNDIDSSAVLVPGSRLQIPLLGKGFLEQRGGVRGMAQQSGMSSGAPSQKSKYKQNGTAKVTDKVNSKKSKTASGSETYRKAKELLERDEYMKSLRLLRSLDIEFRDVRQLIASTEVFLQQKADAHYRKGISYFLSENLEKAIVEWEEVLRLKPGHLRAQKDLQNARKMQRRVENTD